MDIARTPLEGHAFRWPCCFGSARRWRRRIGFASRRRGSPASVGHVHPTANHGSMISERGTVRRVCGLRTLIVPACLSLTRKTGDRCSLNHSEPNAATTIAKCGLLSEGISDRGGGRATDRGSRKRGRNGARDGLCDPHDTPPWPVGRRASLSHEREALAALHEDLQKLAFPKFLTKAVA